MKYVALIGRICYYAMFILAAPGHFTARYAIAAGRLVMPQQALTVQVTLADGSAFPGTGTLNFADLALQPSTSSWPPCHSTRRLVLPGLSRERIAREPHRRPSLDRPVSRPI